MHSSWPMEDRHYTWQHNSTTHIYWKSCSENPPRIPSGEPRKSRALSMGCYSTPSAVVAKRHLGRYLQEYEDMELNGAIGPRRPWKCSFTSVPRRTPTTLLVGRKLSHWQSRRWMLKKTSFNSC